MNDPHRLRLALAEARTHVIGIGGLAPRVPELVDGGAVAGGHRGPALAEVPRRDDEVRLAGRDEVRDGRLERAGARGGEEQHLLLGAAHFA
jgi:hypothetical protein